MFMLLQPVNKSTNLKYKVLLFSGFNPWIMKDLNLWTWGILVTLMSWTEEIEPAG